MKNSITVCTVVLKFFGFFKEILIKICMNYFESENPHCSIAAFKNKKETWR